MPEGRYAVFDDGPLVGSETFRCAPGPIGWRYVADIETDDPRPHREVVDLAVDRHWRLARLRVETGQHELLLEPRGDELVGVRDGAPIEVAYGPAMHVDYFTPATNLITTKRLDATAEIDVLYLEPFTLEPTRTRQRYELGGAEEVDTPSGRFAGERWTFTDLETGWSADLWVAGDVVVRYDRLFELRSYDPGASGARPLPPPS